MKLLKYIFFLLLIVIIGGAVYFGTQDGSYNIMESKVINAPSSVVYNNVNDYKNWPAWSPWLEKDPETVLTYGTSTTGKDANYAWESDHMEVGKGSMKTIDVKENESIHQEIIFHTPMGESRSDVNWLFESTTNSMQTKVSWGMKGEQSFMEKVFMFFQEEDLETMVSKSYRTGLEKLEDQLQIEMKKYSIEVKGMAEHGGGYYMYVTSSAKGEELSSKMGTMYGQIMSFMDTQQIQSSGMPFTIYHETDEMTGNMILSAGIPVKERIDTPVGSSVLCGYLQPTTAIKTILTGNYENLPEAYTKAQEYINNNNLLTDSSKKMFEVYANDPGEFPNPANWRTEIFIPVFKDLRSNHPIINGK
ncbi:MAG: SRPBCC family protein [Bacteroidetes bacterium]|nr:SRPBCC family protein [Bacteroidota bacterium]